MSITSTKSDEQIVEEFHKQRKCCGLCKIGTLYKFLCISCVLFDIGMCAMAIFYVATFLIGSDKSHFSTHWCKKYPD